MVYDEEEVKQMVESEYELINTYLRNLTEFSNSKEEFDYYAFGVLNHTFQLITIYRKSEFYRNLPKRRECEK